jgi:hypothetical protein
MYANSWVVLVCAIEPFWLFEIDQGYDIIFMFFLHNRITSMPLKEKICLSSIKGYFCLFILHYKTILLP